MKSVRNGKLVKTSPVKLKEDETSSCMDKMQKSWGTFMRKVFHLSPKDEKVAETTSYSKEPKELKISPKGKGSLPPSTKTSTCFRAETFDSSTSMIESEDLEPELYQDMAQLQAKYVSTRDDRQLMLLALPRQVRGKIYSSIEPQDILNMRLTCKQIKNDVESNHGVILRLHDGRLDYEKPLQTLGIAKLIVEQFLLEDKSVYDSYFPYPSLLKTIEVAGPITQTNLRFLLKISVNLTQLIVSFQQPILDQNLQAFSMNRVGMKNLKILEINSDSHWTIAEDAVVTSSIRDIWSTLNCPVMSCFIFDMIGVLPERVDEYHEVAMSFILKFRRSLKRVQIQLVTPGLHFSNTRLENERWTNEWEETQIVEHRRCKLESIQLTLNTNVQYWYPLIESQAFLQTLRLDLSGQSWSRLTAVLNKCGRSLRNLSVVGLLPSNFRIDVTSTFPEPVDIASLQDMKVLENLEIQHQEIETRGYMRTSVVRTTLFPQSLRVVKLVHLRLKPYQVMFLFLKLPKIHQLVLNFWTDTEGTFAGFIAVLGFLIKFDQTPVRAVEMKDFRRKLENQQESILRLKNILHNQANVMQSNSELYSTLSIERYFNK